MKERTQPCSLSHTDTQEGEAGEVNCKKQIDFIEATTDVSNSIHSYY